MPVKWRAQSDKESPPWTLPTSPSISTRRRATSRPALARSPRRSSSRSRRRPSDATAGCPTTSSPTSSARRSRAGSTGGLHDPEHGGQGWTRLQWALVEEQYGRSTNAIHWHIPNGYNVWEHAGPEHTERWLEPLLRGEIRDAYAVTERDAGSDPSRIAATATPKDAGDGWLLNGEKWFVTSGDVASVYIVMANVIDDGEKLPTLFVVDE